MNVYKCFRWEIKPVKGGFPRYYFKLPIVIAPNILKMYGICSSGLYPDFYYTLVHHRYLNEKEFYDILDRLYDYITSQYELGGIKFLESQETIDALLK